VCDALTGGRRLWLLATGTGLAPFLSLARDPEVYDRFSQVIVVHGVRRVSDLAFRDELVAQLAGDPLVADQALLQFHYLPTVTREPFHTAGRIPELARDGRLFAAPVQGPRGFDPATDRVMLCGSTAMIRETAAMLEAAGLREGANANPADYVIERAFVG
jgi:ferredoxin--NADP+ reductase